MTPRAGCIYRHDAFYLSRANGKPRPKYLLVLAVSKGGDVVARLLTSRHAAQRPTSPPCFHGDPWPGFFLGVLGGNLVSSSWLDLRPLEDFRAEDFTVNLRLGTLRKVTELPARLLRSAMACVAAANDTTQQQAQDIHATLAELPA